MKSWGKPTVSQPTSSLTKLDVFEKQVGGHVKNAIYSVKKHCGETIFHLTSRFTKLEVFVNLRGAHTESAVDSTLWGHHLPTIWFL